MQMKKFKEKCEEVRKGYEKIQFVVSVSVSFRERRKGVSLNVSQVEMVWMVWSYQFVSLSCSSLRDRNHCH